MRVQLATLACLVLVGAPVADAWATPSFPGVIASHLGASAAPACSVCHEGGVTGRGTVTTPFGQAMLARGLVAYDEGSLTRALDAMAQDAVDSNRDGVTDVDALKAGQDPSAGATGAVVPEYGCVGSTAHAPANAGLGAAATLLMLAAWCMRARVHRARAEPRGAADQGTRTGCVHALRPSASSTFART
jgi:hypothetical protein